MVSRKELESVVLYLEESNKVFNTQIEIDKLLKLVVDQKASDFHLKVPSPPVLRIDGELQTQKDFEILRPQDIEAVFEQITNQEQRVDFFREKELDFAYSIPGLARFRVNILWQRGSMGIAFRMIPFHVPTIDELNYPRF